PALTGLCTAPGRALRPAATLDPKHLGAVAVRFRDRLGCERHRAQRCLLAVGRANVAAARATLLDRRKDHDALANGDVERVTTGQPERVTDLRRDDNPSHCVEPAFDT